MQEGFGSPNCIPQIIIDFKTCGYGASYFLFLPRFLQLVFLQIWNQRTWSYLPTSPLCFLFLPLRGFCCRSPEPVPNIANKNVISHQILRKVFVISRFNSSACFTFILQNGSLLPNVDSISLGLKICFFIINLAWCFFGGISVRHPYQVSRMHHLVWLSLHLSFSRTGVMRPKIAATLEGVKTNQLYKGPQAKLKKRPPKVCCPDYVVMFSFQVSLVDFRRPNNCAYPAVSWSFLIIWGHLRHQWSWILK